MDFFNINMTLKYIEKADKDLINEMDNITFEYNKLSNEGHKLLQILNYSPKVSQPDINKVKKLPRLTIPQLSELKNLNYSLLDNKNNNVIIDSNISDKEKEDMIKSILYSIIDNAIDNNNNNIIITDEDEDEDYAKILRKTKKKYEEENQRDKELNTTASRLGLEMNLLNQLKVYLFNNNDYIIINITPKDKIKSIKEKIIKKLIDTKKYKLKNFSEEAYEIRMIEENNEDNIIMGSSPLNDNESLFKEKINAIAFLENQNYISENNNNKSKDDEDDKINVKIYYRKNGITNSKLFILSKNDILKNILNSFFEQNIFKDKNANQYYFIEHNSINDIENEIYLDTNIKDLSSYELDLCKKDYYEIPELINEYNLEIKKDFYIPKDDDIISKEQENNRFNEISGGLYQEFEVYKINKYKTKKKRILGIDMYNLYNNLPKKNNSGLMNILFKETKHPVRSIENVRECVSVGNNGLHINIKEEDKNEIKKLNYEAKNSEMRDEIVDKINFLINYHKNNKNN